MADLLDFNAARRARGLPVIDPETRTTRGNLYQSAHGPACEARHPLDAETRINLRRWRCFEARLTQIDAAERAGVTAAAWFAAERGRPVSDAVRLRILSTWAQSKSV